MINNIVACLLINLASNKLTVTLKGRHNIQRLTLVMTRLDGAAIDHQ